jgi:phage head maturation protease/predicted  nucleic acid-binding Zn-ribbon protein
MSTFNKSKWTMDEDTIQIGVEFSKVNKQKRLVSGWATLDNVDTENDVVTAEASAEAFAKARGNLREMHKKDSAVGRVVSFKEDTLRVKEDDGTYNEYRGIFVTARVSEGAEDTWLKVVDGTLSAFSIGGAIVESEEAFNKDRTATIRKVTKYDLTELSLVDNPGNQHANVFRIQKSVDGSVTAISGMTEEHKVLNVFFCKEHQIIQEKPDNSYSCPVCSHDMDVIGFVEDSASRTNKVEELMTKYLDVGRDNMSGINKSVENEEELESVVTGHEEGDPTEIPTPARTDVVEEVTDDEVVEEVQDEEEAISKKIDTFKTDITGILSKNNKDTSERIEALEKAIADIGRDFSERSNEFDKKLSELDQGLDKARKRLTDFDRKLDKVNSGSALRKSTQSNDSVEIEQTNESDWDGAFSVKNLL